MVDFFQYVLLLFSFVKSVWTSFICSLPTVDIVFTISFISSLFRHDCITILFSSNWCVSLYFSTTTTIANGFWFSVIVCCLSTAPAISGCKTSLHFQNSAYILCYIDLSFPFFATASWLSNRWKIDLLCLTFRKLNDRCYYLLSSVFYWLHAQWTISLV